MKKTKPKSTTEIAINNKKIDLAKTIRSEVNLLLLPFFTLERKDKRLETEYREIKQEEGLKKEKIWNVSANPKYGYPGPFDREVHKAIEQILSEIFQEKGKIENPIPFSIYDLCDRMGITTSGGKNYREVKRALERIKVTAIKSEKAFYLKDKKEWTSSIFSLYDGVIFRGEQLEDGSLAEINLLFLSDLYLGSLNSRYTKPIDYAYWQSLKSKIASRLYEILGVMFYGIQHKKDCDIHFKYTTLCQLLPLIPYKYFSDAKRQLNPAHKELKDTGFISNYEWSENGKKDWLIHYWPGERAKEEIKKAKLKGINNINHQDREYLPEPQEEGEKYSEEQVNLINKLVKLNVSKITAENLVKSKDQELIKEWMEAINYTDAKDRAAYLVKALRENWQLPEEYLKGKEEFRAKEEQEKANILKKKKQERKDKEIREEKEKLDQIYYSLDPVKQKEIDREVENRLDDFWKSQLNKQRSKGKLSKILQTALDEKRREIIKNQINIDL